MRTTVNIRDIIGCFVSQAYKLHPYNEPQKVNEIARYLKGELKKEFSGHGNYIEIYDEDFYKKLKAILMGCLEFRQLNISKHRWNLGQRDIYDEGKYFGSSSDDAMENACIDLNALMQNMNYEFWALHEAEQDCFLCKFAKEYGSTEPSCCEECKSCSCNPNLKFNRVSHPWSLLPRNSKEYQNLVKDGSISGMEL